MDDLTTTLAEVDEDLVRNCTLLDNKTQVLEKKQRAISNASPSPSSLNMSTPIFDDNGIQASTLGRLLQDNIDLSCSNKLLKGRIERLSADVIAQGGVTLSVRPATEGWSPNHPVLREAEEAIEISVSDTGKGIPSEHLPHIFERYWRAADPDDGAAGTSSGLGLAIVKRIAALHGGSVELRNRSGGGLEARVCLPLGLLLPRDAV